MKEQQIIIVMKTMSAVSFVSSKTLHLSALCASKMLNLNPVPDDITFITPDANLLRQVHANKINTCGIKLRYWQDDMVASMLGVNLYKGNSLGWLSRQWIQMHLDLLITDSQYILTCDSDLIVNRPLRLIDDGRINLFIETEHYEPYFTTIRKMLPDLKTFLPMGESFNSEIMLLVPDQLHALRRAINMDHETWKAICMDVPAGSRSFGFSEYETIGTWMINNARSKVNLVRSDTYGRNNHYHSQHKLSQLLAIQEVLPLRSVFDTDIAWFE